MSHKKYFLSIILTFIFTGCSTHPVKIGNNYYMSSFSCIGTKQQIIKSAETRYFKNGAYYLEEGDAICVTGEGYNWGNYTLKKVIKPMSKEELRTFQNNQVSTAQGLSNLRQSMRNYSNSSTTTNTNSFVAGNKNNLNFNTTNSNNGGYQGYSGTKYQYDMSKQDDKMNYQYDIDAQRRDMMKLPSTNVDHLMGQQGGGVY